jgi:hypothetical protein
MNPTRMDILNLGKAAELLGDQARNFSEVYKLYGFGDTQPLSDYADFFLHEPVAWFEGLPGSLKSKASFAKPKTAFSKLVKHSDVIAALGEEACAHLHAVLWDTYKHEADRIVTQRSSSDAVKADSVEIVAEAVTDVVTDVVTEVEAPTTRRSRKQKVAVQNTVDPGPPQGPTKAPPTTFETKYRVIDRAFRAMASDGSAVSEALLVFLDALKDL